MVRLLKYFSLQHSTMMEQDPEKLAQRLFLGMMISTALPMTANLIWELHIGKYFCYCHFDAFLSS
jgi:hypothetical protein